MLGLTLLGGASAEAAITTRTQEPAVFEGQLLPQFAGDPVDRIVLYKYTGFDWVEIPFQVDEREVDESLLNNMPENCRYAWDPCELTYVISGFEGGLGTGLDGNDEIAFMARDAGTTASASSWVGTPGVDTRNVRYRIAVRDPVSGEQGYVYAYSWLTAPNHQPGVADYVTWTGPGSETCEPAGEPSCGWMKATDQGSISTVPRSNLFFRGNWTPSALCIRTGGDPGDCGTLNDSVNVLDIGRWKTFGPSETGRQWDQNCRAFLGVKDGPVRIFRRIQGAMSGRYTTKLEIFYGTWLEQIVNIRVHPIDALVIAFDHRSADFVNPPGETPALFFTRTHSQNHGSQAADPIDGEPGSFDSSGDDWYQVDTSRGTYVTYYKTPRGFRDVTRTFFYNENRSGGDFQPGRFGDAGWKFSGDPDLPNFEDMQCLSDPEDPMLNFARGIRTFVPLAVDVPTGGAGEYLSEEGERYWDYQETPLILAAVSEDDVTPLPPVDPICTPPVSGSVTNGGFANSLNVNTSGCGIGFAGVLLYRGVTPGIYVVLADLGPATTFDDMQIRVGTSYRYVARAYDRDGNLGPQSAELVLTVTDTIAPPPPTGLIMTPGSQQLVVSWDEIFNRDARGVYVEISTTSGGTFTRDNPGQPVPANQPSYALVNLEAGQTYYLKLKTVDYVGNESDYSIEVSGTPDP